MPGIRAAVILAALVAALYLHTLGYDWQFDDKPNIRDNPSIHLQSLRPEALWKILHAEPVTGSGVNRPLARLSFALNWYAGGENPNGYRAVNILLHWLVALSLYGVMALILDTPVGRRKIPASWSRDVVLLSVILMGGKPYTNPGGDLHRPAHDDTGGIILSGRPWLLFEMAPG